MEKARLDERSVRPMENLGASKAFVLVAAMYGESHRAIYFRSS
jgi:hypothetical protein